MRSDDDFHIDYHEVHYCKVLLDLIFGRDCFLNEVIWAYDYGARTTKKWPPKHDNILVYVRDPDHYFFDAEAIERIPYMAPGLVGPDKADRGKLPTDTWWHTIVPTHLVAVAAAVTPSAQHRGGHGGHLRGMTCPMGRSRLRWTPERAIGRRSPLWRRPSITW